MSTKTKVSYTLHQNDKLGGKYKLDNYHEVKRNGKVIGEVHGKDGNWSSLHHESDRSYDMHDTKKQAMISVVSDHKEFVSDLKSKIRRHTSMLKKLGESYSKQIINSLVTDNKDEAKSAFQSSIQEKMNSMFEVRKVGVASQIMDELETVNEAYVENHISDTHDLVHKNGKKLKIGDKVKSDRESYTITGWTAPHHEGSSGRVHTNKGSYYPSVIDANLVNKKTGRYFGDGKTNESTDAMGNGIASKELVAFADNHSSLYRQSHQPIMANLKKKVVKGTYDHEKAKTLWGYHADRAAMAYSKEHGDKSQPWHKMFSKADRKAAASEFADNAKDELHEGVNEEDKPEEKKDWEYASPKDYNMKKMNFAKIKKKILKK